jgi:hypothetical protein
VGGGGRGSRGLMGAVWWPPGGGGGEVKGKVGEVR